MVRALFDTNILIDYLNAVPQARAELERYDERAISIITWIEVLIGATAESEKATRQFLAEFKLIGLDGNVAKGAVELRGIHKMKLPDAIIWASAKQEKMLLVTRNTKDFPANNPGIRNPY